ncbi:contractile injection system tape measure protein, partial [bacterium]|nr:contractile injection system tape measure protein [bacterium]
QSELPEHLLLLNKVICGMPLEQPIPLGIELTDDERKISEHLLLGVLQNWPMMKTSSIDTLRGGFLMREGLLLETEENWILRIPPGPYDMILDTLPWSTSMIKLSWMEKILQAEWK